MITIITSAPFVGPVSGQPRVKHVIHCDECRKGAAIAGRPGSAVPVRRLFEQLAQVCDHALSELCADDKIPLEVAS